MNTSKFAKFWLLVVVVLFNYQRISGESCGGGCGRRFCAQINVGVLTPVFVKQCDPCRCTRTGPNCRSPCFKREDSNSANEGSLGEGDGDETGITPGDGACVESEWLERQGLLKMHSVDRRMKALCPEGLPCGTPSHILTVRGQPVTYATLCASETCGIKIARVNTFVWTAGTTVGIESPERADVKVTPFALTGWTGLDMLQMRLARICSRDACEYRLSARAVRIYQALERSMSRSEECHGKLLKCSLILIRLMLRLTSKNASTKIRDGSHRIGIWAEGKENASKLGFVLLTALVLVLCSSHRTKLSRKAGTKSLEA